MGHSASSAQDRRLIFSETAWTSLPMFVDIFQLAHSIRVLVAAFSAVSWPVLTVLSSPPCTFAVIAVVSGAVNAHKPGGFFTKGSNITGKYHAIISAAAVTAWFTHKALAASVAVSSFVSAAFCPRLSIGVRPCKSRPEVFVLIGRVVSFPLLSH